MRKIILPIFVSLILVQTANARLAKLEFEGKVTKSNMPGHPVGGKLTGYIIHESGCSPKYSYDFTATFDDAIRSLSYNNSLSGGIIFFDYIKQERYYPAYKNKIEYFFTEFYQKEAQYREFKMILQGSSVIPQIKCTLSDDTIPIKKATVDWQISNRFGTPQESIYRISADINSISISDVKITSFPFFELLLKK